MHLFWQSSYIVVTLNNLSCNIQGFDAVGIDSTLCQPLGIGNLLCLGIEDLDEVTTDNLTLLFGISNTFQVGKELLTGVHSNDIQSQHLVVFHHLLELILSQHTMINKDTRQPVAYSTVQQNGSNTGVDTTRETKDNTVFTQLLFQFCNRGINKRGSTPILTATTYTDNEVFQQQRTLDRVEHFGMELDGEDWSLTPNPSPKGEGSSMIIPRIASLRAFTPLAFWRGVGGEAKCGILHIICRSNTLESFGNGSDAVTMTHPHL